MKIPPLRAGAILACLTLLSACSTLQTPAATPRPIVLQPCLPMVACSLPTRAPATNRQLAQALIETRVAFETCAAQVDSVIACQQRVQETTP